MRYNLLLASVFLMVSLSTGCSDDDSSEPKDPCEGVVCANGGTCEQGDCKCPEGFGGEECRDEKTPRTIKVKSISVKEYPLQTSSGEAWDVFSSFPDMYLAVSNNNNVITSTNVRDEVGGETVGYGEGLPVGLNNPTVEYTIAAYDFDSSSDDDFMGGVRFTPYQEGRGFPNPIIVEAGDFKFELSVEYNF